MTGLYAASLCRAVSFRGVPAHPGDDPLRECGMSKGNSTFCRVPFIPKELRWRMDAIHEDYNYGRLAGRKEFVTRTAEHIGELNAIHPFHEGNGRTMRLFLKALAQKSGHKLDLTRIVPRSWEHASIHAFEAQNCEPMRRVIDGALGARSRTRVRRKRERADEDRGREY